MSDTPTPQRIEGRVAGDDWTIRLTVLDVPAGQTIAEAWFTVKKNVKDEDDDAVLQLHILPTPSAEGEIEEVGNDPTPGLPGIIRFDLTPDQTVLFEPHEVYVWDSQIKTNTGKINTPKYAYGTLQAEPQVTRTTG